MKFESGLIAWPFAIDALWTETVTSLVEQDSLDELLQNGEVIAERFVAWITTRLNPQGRVAPLGAFAWMSQKRIWIGRLRHTRQIENHHKKDQILVYPIFLIENLFDWK